MWYDEMFTELEGMANTEEAKKMEAYQKNQFSFLGVRKPNLKAVTKPYLKQAPKKELDWKFVFYCWEKPYREAQYVGIEYLASRQKLIKEEELEKLETLLVTKSWWETVDSLDAVVGAVVLRYPEQKKRMLEWSQSDNIWLRRTAIDFQQKYKEETDQDLLEAIIRNNLGSKEFFINKAIGWSLREYSKCNPKWVQGILEKYEEGLSNLSKKEAAKYL